jgi:hypothetical protein
MNLKPNKKLLSKAISSGCRTVSELALYLKTLKQ